MIENKVSDKLKYPLTYDILIKTIYDEEQDSPISNTHPYPARQKIHLPKYGYPLHRPSNKYDEYIPIYHSLLYTQTPDRL